MVSLLLPLIQHYSRPIRRNLHVLLTHALKTSPGHDFTTLPHTRARAVKSKGGSVNVCMTLFVWTIKHALQNSFQLTDLPCNENGQVSRKGNERGNGKHHQNQIYVKDLAPSVWSNMKNMQSESLSQRGWGNAALSCINIWKRESTQFILLLASGCSFVSFLKNMIFLL